jgi:hypothetical protein
MWPSQTTGLGDDGPLSVGQVGTDFPAELLQDVRVRVEAEEGRLARLHHLGVARYVSGESQDDGARRK